MSKERTAIRNQAYSDVILSSRVGVVPWNRPCVHRNLNFESIRSEMRRLTAPGWQAQPDSEDIKRLRELCRCCIRLLPDWPILVAESIDACFSFPDSIARGLLWRSVIFALRTDVRSSYGVSELIKRGIARHLYAEAEQLQVLVDGFIDMLESNCMAADVGVKSSENASDLDKQSSD